MSGGKLPTTVALDHCVRELHDSVEWFAVRCSFHARFSENNCRVIAVKPRLHVVVFKYVVMDFPAAQLVDLVRTRAHFAIRERQRKIRREHTLQRGQRLRQETLCTRRARTGARPFHPWFARVRIGRRKQLRKQQASRSSYHIGTDYFFLFALTLPGTKPVAYRLSSQIQFVSHVFPPSAEKACSIRADFGEIFNQT